MKILSFAVSRLRNAEHFQFMTEFKELVERFGVSVLKIAKLFTVFLQLFEKEDECQIVVQKSAYTEKIIKADQLRDGTFRGLCDAVNSALNHFDADKAEAARQLKIVLRAYGNLAQKSSDEETSGIYNLIQDLEDKYAGEVDLVGIADWVAELKKNNEAYKKLVQERDAESAEKPDENMRRVRMEVDSSYRDMVSAVESLALLADDEAEITAYNGFIRELNAVITRYSDRLAQRDGIAEAKKKEETDEGDE